MRNMEIKSSQKGIDNLAALGAAHRHSSSSLYEDVLTQYGACRFYSSEYDTVSYKKILSLEIWSNRASSYKVWLRVV